MKRITLTYEIWITKSKEWELCVYLLINRWDKQKIYHGKRALQEVKENIVFDKEDIARIKSLKRLTKREYGWRDRKKTWSN